jgi:hypothetical protein
MTVMDMRPRWTIQKNPPHLPVSKDKPWAIYETAARLHGEPLMERFQSCPAAKAWAIENAPDDTEVIVVKRLKRACRYCGQEI